MAEYKKGQRVKVTLESVIEDEPDGPGDVAGLRTATGRYYAIAISEPGCTIETMEEPGNWPPQAGDIWAICLAGGAHEFFVRKAHNGTILLTPDDGGTNWTPDMLSKYNPVLVRRRGE